MPLRTRTARLLAASVVLLGLAAPAALAGIDRGIGVPPWVAPQPDAVDRFLANDRRHHPSQPDALARQLRSGAPAGTATPVVRTEAGSSWSTTLVALSIASSFALGVVATVLVMRSRTITAS